MVSSHVNFSEQIDLWPPLAGELLNTLTAPLGQSGVEPRPACAGVAERQMVGQEGGSANPAANNKTSNAQTKQSYTSGRLLLQTSSVKHGTAFSIQTTVCMLLWLYLKIGLHQWDHRNLSLQRCVAWVLQHTDKKTELTKKICNVFFSVRFKICILSDGVCNCYHFCSSQWKDCDILCCMFVRQLCFMLSNKYIYNTTEFPCWASGVHTNTNSWAGCVKNDWVD